MTMANFELFRNLESCPVLDLNPGPLGWKVNDLTTELKCDHTLESRSKVTEQPLKAMRSNIPVHCISRL